MIKLEPIMRKLLFFTILLAGCTTATQDMSYSLPGKTFYNELPNPVTADINQWSALDSDVNVSFADRKSVV